MNKRIISVVAAAALAVTSPAAIALAQTPSKTAPAQRVVAGPSVSASVVGVRRAEVAKNLAPAKGGAHMGAGQNIALMVVGGAALIIGAVIGGTAGVLIAVAGAAIGLYGLYNFVQ